MENFAAFFSYVRADDEHENHRITRLREKLAGEVRMITGEEFAIFQDNLDTHWGQNWDERLNSTLDGTTFLIIAVTPSYLRRPACRGELERFLQREKALGRNDLILPILYLETPTLSDKDLLAADPLAQAINSHQYADWRDLRHEPDTNPEVSKRIEKMAREIEKAMQRSATPTPKLAPKSEPTPTAAPAPAIAETETKTPKISARNEPPILIVDRFPNRGDHTNIVDAVRAAKPGTRILIRPGLYKEALVLDKALELLGDGERQEIIVETFGTETLIFNTEFGRVANLTLRQNGGDNSYGVWIMQGRLELEDCDITSRSRACVGIMNGADPRLRRNCIHDGKASGVLIYENGKGTLEDNDIFANDLAGVTIKEGSDPTLRRNRIHDGKESGVVIAQNAKGILEENDIFANALTGVAITDGSDPTLRRNHIHNGKDTGILIYENGKGMLEDNDIFANALSGIQVIENANPIVRSNRITANKNSGIYVHDSGGGIFEKNDLRGNREPWNIDASSKAKVTKSGNIES